jgi:hypothetical protein
MIYTRGILQLDRLDRLARRRTGGEGCTQKPRLGPEPNRYRSMTWRFQQPGVDTCRQRPRTRQRRPVKEHKSRGLDKSEAVEGGVTRARPQFRR